MVVPESGETQQSVCEAAGGPTETDMHVSDQEDLGLLLQVKKGTTDAYLKLLHACDAEYMNPSVSPQAPTELQGRQFKRDRAHADARHLFIRENLSSRCSRR